MLSMPDLPLLLLPAAVGVVCAALALTAARRRPGAPNRTDLDRRATPPTPSPQNATQRPTVSKAVDGVVQSWAGPPSATRDATRDVLHACKITDARQPAAAWAEQTALIRYAAWTLAGSAHRIQAHLIPNDVTVSDVVIPDDPDATLADLASLRMLQATIRGDRKAALDVITTHAATANDPLSLAVAEARIGAILTQWTCRVGAWIRAIPAMVDAHTHTSAGATAEHHVCVCGGCDEHTR